MRKLFASHGPRNFGFLLVAAWSVLAFPRVGFSGDDFQTWHTVEIVRRLNPKWEFFFMPEVRLRDNSGELFYHEYRQGVRFKLSNHLTLGLNYLFVRNESSGKPLDEHTGELDITPKTRWGPWDLSVRGRVALRTIERSAGEQEFQIRLMPKIAYPTRLFGQKMAPYIASDFFYDYTRDAVNQVRFFLGVSVPVKSSLPGVETSVDFYYMSQNQLGSKRHDWNSNHILGTKLKVLF